jgi:leucyl aminopeptidase (aminopeptidase T)
VRGTCHVAFGSSFGINGRVKSEVHWDGIIIAPTVYFDDERIMDKGDLLI